MRRRGAANSFFGHPLMGAESPLLGPLRFEKSLLTFCPIAIAVGCKKCPLFAVCPVKSIIGDYKPGVSENGNEKSKAGRAKDRVKKSR